MKRPKKPFRVIPAGKDDAIPEHDPGTKRFIDKVRFLHGFANTVLVAIFTWLQLRELLDGILANSNTRILLWHGGLALYYASWVFGTGFDLKSA